MSRNAIIDEVRGIRDAIALAHNYDLEAIFRMLREREARSDQPHVTLPPKRLHVERPSKTGEAVQQADQRPGR